MPINLLTNEDGTIPRNKLRDLMKQVRITDEKGRPMSLHSVDRHGVWFVYDNPRPVNEAVYAGGRVYELV